MPDLYLAARMHAVSPNYDKALELFKHDLRQDKNAPMLFGLARACPCCSPW